MPCDSLLCSAGKWIMISFPLVNIPCILETTPARPRFVFHRWRQQLCDFCLYTYHWEWHNYFSLGFELTISKWYRGQILFWMSKATREHNSSWKNFKPKIVFRIVAFLESIRKLKQPSAMNSEEQWQGPQVKCGTHDLVHFRRPMEDKVAAAGVGQREPRRF